MEYTPVGDGYFAVDNDSSRCCYGIPPELDEERLLEWQAESLYNREIEKVRRAKAMRFIRESDSRDINYKVGFLKKFGYESAYVRGGKVSLDKIEERHYSNVTRMYNRVINELREVVKNPSKKSKLVERLDNLQ